MAEILAGTLGPVRLGSLLQLVEMEGLDARLTVGTTGEVLLRQGTAVFARAGRTQGLDALYDLFMVDQGRFLLEDAEVSASLRPLGTMVNLVIEGSRIADEWARLAPLVLKVAPGVQAAPVLLRLADGVLPVWAACARVGESPASVVDVLADALREGLVVQVGAQVPRPGGGGLDLSQRFDACMEGGRQALRARDFALAESSFQQACALDPESTVARQNLRRVQQLRRVEEGA